MKKAKLFAITIMAVVAVLALAACGEKDGGKPAVSIELSVSSVTLAMGQEQTVVATVRNTDALPEWRSDNESVATVSGGRIKAVSDGTATVTVRVGGKTASVAVTVSSEETLVLDRTSVKVFKGKTAKLTATVRRGLTVTDETVEWESGDPTVVTVSDDGTVTGVKVAKDPVEVTAKTRSGKTATCFVKVDDVVIINLSHTELTLNPNGNDTARITATGKKGSYNISASSIVWTSSDPDTVSVKVSGNSVTLTAKKSGKVAVTASVAGAEETAVCVVDSWYAISAPADMEYLRKDINGTFKLVNDIDFGGAMWDGVTKWAGDDVPDSAYFGGVLDGQGFSIKNINILAGWNNGIIGQTAPTSIIRNLSIVNLVNQDTSNKVGSIISYNKGLIENCYIENTIKSDSQNNWNSHGGIVACNAASGIIRNCIVKVTAERRFRNCGAIVGYNVGAVENCYAVCTDAMLPMYGEWISGIGYFSDCGVYSSVDSLVANARLYKFSDRIWTKTDYDMPALYNFPEVTFESPVTYFAQGSAYVVSPSNIRGIPIEWTVDDGADVLEVTENADHSLTVAAKRRGEAKLTAAIYNGSYASTTVIVTGTVISPEREYISIDYNNPALASTAKIKLVNDRGEAVGSGVSYISSDTSVATVDEYGNVTAVGGGRSEITVSYGGDVYESLVKIDVTGWVQISSAEQLQAIENGIDLNYCLVDDIDFGGEVFRTITPWTNSDNDAVYFNGIFDGNGHTVSNVVVRGNDRGIFGRTATSAIIRNTVFDNIVFKPADGAKEQKNFGIVSFNTGTIQDCIVRAVVEAGYAVDYMTGGGICGTNEFRGRIYNCISYVDASAVGSGVYVGSIMGLCQGVAKDCIGIVTASTAASIDSICFINSSSVSNCKQYTSEAAAVADCKPFGSFDPSVWNITDDALPTLKILG